MKSAILLLIAFLVLARVEAAIEILRVQGSVSISVDSGKTWEALTRVTPVKPSDQIKTGADSYVDLRHEGGWLGRLLPGSLVEIKATQERNDKPVPMVALRQGAFVAAADPAATGTMEVFSPGGVCGSYRPAAFQITEEGVTDCAEGHVIVVHIAPPHPAPANLKAGQRLPKMADWPADHKERLKPIPEPELIKLKQQIQELRGKEEGEVKAEGRSKKAEF